MLFVWLFKFNVTNENVTPISTVNIIHSYTYYYLTYRLGRMEEKEKEHIIFDCYNPRQEVNIKKRITVGLANYLKFNFTNSCHKVECFCPRLYMILVEFYHKILSVA